MGTPSDLQTSWKGEEIGEKNCGTVRMGREYLLLSMCVYYMPVNDASGWGLFEREALGQLF
jgi:hypothetical protein